MSQFVHSSDGSIAASATDVVVADEQLSAANAVKSPRSRPSRWRLTKIYSARGLFKLQSVKTSSWVTAVGMCLVVWGLAAILWPQTETKNQDSQIDHLVAGAELGAVELGAATGEIQQVEFLSESSSSPDAAFLPMEVAAPGPAIPGGAAGDHDSPAWLVGTIEDEPTQRVDTSSK
ncbi:hypothetical protein CA54_25210 [Symmachiella macrocystis]|uniref:Transmembrane protein n=1 Tax=Symmachiella macrocystis TaxID=2527985 RepID=A0A5C6BR40_9PLAN|nr:hypothetical protein [Symmachiella macrocystis]TWU13686.1 hypothetical protein CA54_25210 [Symmachiella macrocystis]